jgi:hypothetical protein
MGLSLVAQIMLGSGPGSGLVQMVVVKCYTEYFRLSQAILFSQRNVVRSCAYFMLITQLTARNKSHQTDSLGDCNSYPLPERG